MVAPVMTNQDHLFLLKPEAKVTVMCLDLLETLYANVVALEAIRPALKKAAKANDLKAYARNIRLLYTHIGAASAAIDMLQRWGDPPPDHLLAADIKQAVGVIQLAKDDARDDFIEQWPTA